MSVAGSNCAEISVAPRKVVDRTRRLVGILTLADFMRHADLDGPQGLGGKLRAFVSRSGLTHSDRPEVVGQIMTRQVRVASADPASSRPRRPTKPTASTRNTVLRCAASAIPRLVPWRLWRNGLASWWPTRLL